MTELVIKKTLQPIYDVLVENSNRKVSSILEEFQHLFLAKTKGGEGTGLAQKATLRDASGAVVAIRCYYFKRWMPLVGEAAVEVGTKANSSTGYNSMCKEGTNLWTKQNRIAKQAQADLLARVESGEVAPHEIADAKELIEQERKAIADTELGFATEDEVIEYLVSQGVSFDESAQEA